MRIIAWTDVVQDGAFPPEHPRFLVQRVHSDCNLSIGVGLAACVTGVPRAPT